MDEVGNDVMKRIREMTAPPIDPQANEVRNRRPSQTVGAKVIYKNSKDRKAVCNGCNEGGELLCCTRCPVAYHFGCCDPPITEQDAPSLGEWLCKKCTSSLPPSARRQMPVFKVKLLEPSVAKKLKKRPVPPRHSRPTISNKTKSKRVTMKIKPTKDDSNSMKKTTHNKSPLTNREGSVKKVSKTSPILNKKCLSSSGKSTRPLSDKGSTSKKATLVSKHNKLNKSLSRAHGGKKSTKSIKCPSVRGSVQLKRAIKESAKRRSEKNRAIVKEKTERKTKKVKPPSTIPNVSVKKSNTGSTDSLISSNRSTGSSKTPKTKRTDIESGGKFLKELKVNIFNEKPENKSDSVPVAMDLISNHSSSSKGQSKVSPASVDKNVIVGERLSMRMALKQSLKETKEDHWKSVRTKVKDPLFGRKIPLFEAEPLIDPQLLAKLVLEKRAETGDHIDDVEIADKLVPRRNKRLSSDVGAASSDVPAKRRVQSESNLFKADLDSIVKDVDSVVEADEVKMSSIRERKFTKAAKKSFMGYHDSELDADRKSDSDESGATLVLSPDTHVLKPVSELRQETPVVEWLDAEVEVDGSVTDELDEDVVDEVEETVDEVIVEDTSDLLAGGCYYLPSPPPVASETTEVAEPSPSRIQSTMDVLLRAASLTNPTEYSLPAGALSLVNLPSTSIGTKQPEPRRTIEPINGVVPQPPRFCFVCSATCRLAALIECDFCPLVYHLDCLTPPLAVPPVGQWLCPAHPDHGVPEATSIRYSERLKAHSSLREPVDQHAVKLSFIKQAARAAQHWPPHGATQFVARRRTSVPPAVAAMYERPLPPTTAPSGGSEPSAYRNALLTDDETSWLRSVIQIQSEFVRSESREALQRVLPGASRASECEETRDDPDGKKYPTRKKVMTAKMLEHRATLKQRAAVAQSPPRKAVNVVAPLPQSASRATPTDRQRRVTLDEARRFLEELNLQMDTTRLPDIYSLDPGIRDILAMQRLRQMFPLAARPASAEEPLQPPEPPLGRAVLVHTDGTRFSMTSSTLAIGNSDESDVNLSGISGCNRVSPEHAVIVYDKHSNSFELINYSEFGTVVDSVAYACGLPSRCGPVLGDTTSGGYWKPIVNPQGVACGCGDSDIPGMGWEGPANLRNGSRIQIGCHSLQFVPSVGGSSVSGSQSHTVVSNNTIGNSN